MWQRRRDGARCGRHSPVGDLGSVFMGRGVFVVLTHLPRRRDRVAILGWTSWTTKLGTADKAVVEVPTCDQTWEAVHSTRAVFFEEIHERDE